MNRNELIKKKGKCLTQAESQKLQNQCQKPFPFFKSYLPCSTHSVRKEKPLGNESFTVILVLVQYVMTTSKKRGRIKRAAMYDTFRSPASPSLSPFFRGRGDE